MRAPGESAGAASRRLYLITTPKSVPNKPANAASRGICALCF